MDKKLQFLFETLEYYKSMYNNEKIKLLLLKNQNGLYDAHMGIDKGNEEAFIKGAKVNIKNLNIIQLNYIIFIINMKYVIDSSNELINKDMIKFASHKTDKTNNNIIEIALKKVDIPFNYLNQHLKGTHRNSYKYSFWPYYDRTDDELKEISNSLEMGEDVDLTSKVIKNKMISAINNNSRSYFDYYNMLTYFINKNMVNSIEQAYSYSYEEFLEYKENEEIKILDDFEINDSNFKKYCNRFLLK